MKAESDLTMPLELADYSRAEEYLKALGFSDWKGAQGIFRMLAENESDGLNSIFTYLASALGSAADPDRSLVNFNRFVEAYGRSLFRELENNPRVIEMLVTLFSASPFLTEILLRTPDAFHLLMQRQGLTERKTIDQFQDEATASMSPAKTEAGKLDAIRLYQRRQLLRIGTSDFLGLYDLRAVFSQLSRQAIGLVRACLALAEAQTGVPGDDLTILAAGKLGGWELNYSSDIDLMFAARKDTPENIRLVKQFIDNIARTTAEGFLYRIDLRLRPWGHDGPLINTIEGYLAYFQDHARLWEKQAYLKARVIAGNLALGEELRRGIEPFIFQVSPEEVRSSILAMKLRTEEFLRKKGRKWGEVKLGEGSIRDVEFVVQSLQLTHPSIRTRATLKAIRQLRENELLTIPEAHILTEGYIFLRTTEHYLQMIDYRQTYTLPADSTALKLLARRLGFEGQEAGEQFIERYERHCTAIRSIFLKYVGAESGKGAIASVPEPPEVLEHIARMDASYAATFSEEEIRQHARMAEEVDKKTLAIVDARPAGDSRWKVTVIGYDYLGELSIICGLMFVYGLDIIESQVFTYEPQVKDPVEKSVTGFSRIVSPARRRPGSSKGEGTSGKWSGKQKIVDVFIVRSMNSEPVTPEMWEAYETDLLELVNLLQSGQRREAQGELAKRAGAAVAGTQKEIVPLYPIDIEIDNTSSEKYTVLKISTTDTMGFLYEFSNALALNHVNIVRMDVRSIGHRVSDTIYVNDDKGQKILSEEKQRELRAATVLIKHFTHLLPHSPNPQTALLHFREFLAHLFERPNWPDELAQLERPEVLNALAQLLGVSDFLWDDFLRMQYSNLFPVVRDVDELAQPKSLDQLQKELDAQMAQSADWREDLNAFKDREMFRIDMRHILGQTREFWDFSGELSDLAEVVIKTVYRRCVEESQERYGKPVQPNGQVCPAAMFALGKFGGRELGFASDIELILVYDGEGHTDGRKSVPINEYFEEVLRDFVKSIKARQEGIFRIDLQLRPYGKGGSLAVGLDAFKRYYAPEGPAWGYERQALVKLRPILGERKLIETICRLRDEYVYNGAPFDFTAMRAMRERQLRHLVTAGTFNAKYSPGGLVDLEYLIQALQIIHGSQNPALRLTNIRLTMEALEKNGILTADDYTKLRKAHTFLRWLIDSLRVVRGNTKDVNIPPFESEEFAFLARRLRYGQDLRRLQEDLAQYPLSVLEINQRLLANP
jgi:glutamate-ammonia-ligase adenylyltransferase